MKTLIIFLMLVSTNLYADSIPGFLEIDIMHQNIVLPGQVRGFLTFDTIYGASHEYVSPYIHCNMLMNYNKSDSYTFGLGFKILDNIYIGFDHRLTHYSKSSNYEYIKGSNNNLITIRLKFNID